MVRHVCKVQTTSFSFLGWASGRCMHQAALGDLKVPHQADCATQFLCYNSNGVILFVNTTVFLSHIGWPLFSAERLKELDFRFRNAIWKSEKSDTWRNKKTQQQRVLWVWMGSDSAANWHNHLEMIPSINFKNKNSWTVKRFSLVVRFCIDIWCTNCSRWFLPLTVSRIAPNRYQAVAIQVWQTLTNNKQHFFLEQWFFHSQIPHIVKPSTSFRDKNAKFYWNESNVPTKIARASC